MLSWLRDIHVPEPGGQAFVAGRGIFPNGPGVFGMVAPVAPQGSKLPGLVGKEWEIDLVGIGMLQPILNQLDSTTQTILPCRLQLVQTKIGSTVAPAPGNVCFWATIADQEQYIVTPDVPAQTGSKAAGVYLYTPTRGDFCLIVTAGEVLARASAAAGAAATGDLVTAVQDAGNGNVGRIQTSAAPTTIAIVSALMARLLDAALGNNALAKVCLIQLGTRQI